MKVCWRLSRVVALLRIFYDLSTTLTSNANIGFSYNTAAIRLHMWRSFGYNAAAIRLHMWRSFGYNAAAIQLHMWRSFNFNAAAIRLHMWLILTK